MSGTESRAWWYSTPKEPKGSKPATTHPGAAAAAPGGGATSEGAGHGPETGGLPSISLPSGGGAIRGIDEKLTVNQATGTASLTVGVYTSPARQGFGPALALSYDSGGGNGPFGLGWHLGIPTITRKTSKGLPQYDDEHDTDVFVLAGAEDLVPLRDNSGAPQPARLRRAGSRTYRVRAYRPRVEAGFARIERWTDTASGAVHWRTVSTSNVTNLYGQDPDSRIADPANPSRVFSWLLDLSFDDRGNAIRYVYKTEDTANIAHTASEARRTVGANRYLKRVLYGNDTPYLPGTPQYSSPPTDWCFELVLDYGEHDAATPTLCEQTAWTGRPDPFSTYRSRFEIRTHRLCRRLLMFHCMRELGAAPVLVRSTDLTYHHSQTGADPSVPVLSQLSSITQTGWIATAGGYTTEHLPPLHLGYSPLALDDTLHSLSGAAAANITGAIDGTAQRWIDLEGEGLRGILTKDAGAWWYQANVSAWNPRGGPAAARFEPIAMVATKPTPSAATLSDLNGDGHLCAVDFARPAAGWYEYDAEDGWSPLRLLSSTATVDWADPNLRFIDLNGDGLSDVLITEDQVFTWYPWEVNDGFGEPRRVFPGIDEDLGPAVVFADGEQSIQLADMTGDGLSDLVRIRNGEICYWPNLGFGSFGAKVSMDNAPMFDHADLFNEHLITLADVDGSGTADIAYLGEQPTIWFNQSGNAWTTGHLLKQFPITTLGAGKVQASVFDLLGTGTACAVWTSPLPQDAAAPLRYVDLTAGAKPYLLTTITNNLGAQRTVTYAPSTKFYLQDKAAGHPWVTRLPFPVHVVEKTRTDDVISASSYTCCYTYHHGYYDGVEREFRGFARVETFDTDTLPAASGAGTFTSEPPIDDAGENFDLPTVHTVTWFHTGACVDGADTAALLRGEYWQLDPDAPHLRSTVLPAGASPEELREACRALRGRMLHQELYALDGTAEAANPYTVVDHRYRVDRLQAPLPTNYGRTAFYPSVYGAFYAWEHETLQCHYERHVADPRITHDLTLTIDAYGNITSRAAVSYPRRQPIFDEQGATSISYSQADYTNIGDQADWYRIGVPIETRTYELTGATATLPHGLYAPEALATDASAAPDIPYEATPGPGLQRRLLTRQRTYYAADNLTGGPLPRGRIDSLALVFASYTQRYTPGLLTSVLGTKLTAAVQSSLINSAALVDLDNDGNLWSPSARLTYTPHPGTPDASYARAHFYQPHGSLDPWHNLSTVSYDPHTLLVTSTRDAIGNTVVAEHNYRVLGPWLTTDANLNRNGVRYDALGMITATAVMGKVRPDGTNEGDDLDLSTPEAAPGDNPTTTLAYNLTAYLAWAAEPRDTRHPCPVWIHSRARVSHAVADTAWLETYTYTDGLGRTVLTKAQAEPGDAPQRDGSTGHLVRDHTGALVLADTAKRWVGSGRVVHDNKGNVIKAYEPFFDSSPVYTDENDLVGYGVTAITRYDPLNRAIRVDNPDGAYRRIIFDPWRTISYDDNDTVLDSQWYARRIDGQAGPAERAAAIKAAAHADTPTVTDIDTLGRVFHTVADNGPAGHYATTVTLDIQGHTRATQDALQRTVLTSDYDMAGTEIHHNSVDAGERWLLTDAAGALHHAWDSRGFTVTTDYDVLRRLTGMKVTDSTGRTRLAEKTVYGETAPEAQFRNLRGAPYQHCDEAGVVTTTQRDFKNNILATENQLLADYVSDVDWSADPTLDSEIFTNTITYDALNRITAATAPDASITTQTYNPRSLVAAVGVKLQGAPTVTDVLTSVSYNARAQRETTSYGNGATTVQRYDPETFRLTSITTTRPPLPDTAATHIFATADTVQDVHYTYDPVGNIVHTEDHSLKTIFYANQIASPASDYTYDPIYRLVKAAGREHISRNHPQPTWSDAARTQLSPSDIQAMQPYTETYAYDPVNNFQTVRHHANTGSWTRTYTYDSAAGSANNRLTSSTVGATTEQYTYDAAGNITSMPHLSVMQWDWKDMLHATAQQVTAGASHQTTYYTYDSAGERIRKITNSQHGTRAAQRVYLGSYEIYREYDTAGTITLQRHSLRVTDGGTCLCLIETTTDRTTSPPSPKTLARYQFGNNLDSTAVELDATAALISYEEYYPYGATSLQTGPSQAEVSLKRYRYTGKERDTETGFTYHGARYYVPWLARWLSCDPAGMTDGTNLYQYTSGNPVRHNDPTGTQQKATCTIDPEHPSAVICTPVDAPKADPEVLEVEVHGPKRGSPEREAELRQMAQDQGEGLGPDEDEGEVETDWEDVKQSNFVQGLGGFLAGAGIAQIPIIGPLVGPVGVKTGVLDKPSGTFQWWYGAGQQAAGWAQIGAGGTMMAGGAGGTVAGVVAAPVTGGVSLGVSAGSVGAVAAGLATATQGVANVTAGQLLMKNANVASSSGGGPGKWVRVARRSSGSSLETQSSYSGKPIVYKDGKAYIQEYELGGVRFDRFKNGVLGDVKDNYGFLIKIGSKKAANALRDEAGRQLAVAEKYGLPVEWHVRAQYVSAFKNVLGRKYAAINVIGY